MARLSRQNDELSKEIGRLRLLEEQRKGANSQSSAVPVETSAERRLHSSRHPVVHRPSAIIVEAWDTS